MSLLAQSCATTTRHRSRSASCHRRHNSLSRLLNPRAVRERLSAQAAARVARVWYSRSGTERKSARLRAKEVCLQWNSDMSIRAVSTPNIAFIKYWGNRNEKLRLPAADSLSMTLDRPVVEVMAGHAEQFAVRSFNPDGMERVLKDKEIKRLEKHFLLSKKYLQSIGAAVTFPASVSLEIRSKIPKSVGLASSAAVFSALAEAYGGFADNVSRRDVSVLARLGSGSASRSVFGGFSAFVAGEGEEIGSAYAEQIAPEDQWKLHDVIIIPSQDEKKTGSTEGHALAGTSPLFKARLREIPRRQKECIEALRAKDFGKLQKVAAEDG